jgi:hypothetical protein
MSEEQNLDENLRSKLKNLLDFIQNAKNLTEEELEAKIAEDPELKTLIEAIDLQ